MKIIYNSFLGGVFRTLGKFLAFIVIFIAIGYIASLNDLKISNLLGFGKVYASTNQSLSDAKFQVRGFVAQYDGTPDLVILGESHIERGYQNNGTAVYSSWWNPQNDQVVLARTYNRFYTSSNMTSSRNYTATFFTTFVPAINYTGNNQLVKNITTIQPDKFIYEIGAYDGSNWGDFVKNVSCSTRKVEAANTYKTQCVFQPTKNISQIVVNLYPYASYIGDNYNGVMFNSIIVKDFSMVYDENEVGAINNQTNIIQNGFNETNTNIKDINDSINSSDTSEAQSQANNFFSNFTTNTHGLTGIITAPLSAIQSLTSKTCSPLELPLPFMQNKKLTLPCMRPIYVQNFGNFMTLYDVITLGIVSYWVLVRIFKLVKDFKNPDHDEIEVVDL